MILLSQRDKRWKNEKLGFSNTTIGGYGCLITDLAMMFDTTPSVINEYLKKHKGFLGNLVIWAKVPGFIKRVREYNNADVLAAIKKHGACLVEGDFDNNPRTPLSHWVVFVGNRKAYDPWTGKIVPTSRYTPYKGYAVIDIEKGKKVFRSSDNAMKKLQYYKGIDLTNIESVKVCIDTWKDVVDGKYVKKQEYDDLEKALFFEKEKVKQLQEAVKKMDEQLREKDKTISDLNKKIAILEKQVETTKNKSQADLDKAKIDYEKKLKDMEIRMVKDFELKEKQYKEEIAKLKEQLKEKKIIVKSEYKFPKDFKRRVVLAIKILLGVYDV